jgi:hypothetical protein
MRASTDLIESHRIPVMPALVAGIHVLNIPQQIEDVDGRDEARP